MPSPRDLLLARHRAAEPRLDALREIVLADLERSARRRMSPLDMLRTVWRELVAPCRPVWMTLAAVWVMLLVLNGAGRPRGAAAFPSAEQTIAAMTQWMERRRALAELTTPASAPARTSPETMAPGHSQVSPVAPSGRGAC